MIDSDFYNQYINLGNHNKSGLWKELHATFIAHPEVVAYASKKFQGLKREFRKIVAGAIRSGLGYPPPETITRPPEDQGGFAGLPVTYTRQSDGVSYTRTIIETPASDRDTLEKSFRIILTYHNGNTASSSAPRSLTSSAPSMSSAPLIPSAPVAPVTSVTTTIEAEVSPPEMPPMGISGDADPHTMNLNEQLPVFFDELKKMMDTATEYMAQSL
ncbi:hypothetical protein EDC94DRAFT_696045 [Helicostylum pulchrum]|nr:hypothetical protein EDC94DRAFT_696045 [Helicostylum pulchrum]